jgi:hypothetical protein
MACRISTFRFVRNWRIESCVSNLSVVFVEGNRLLHLTGRIEHANFCAPHRSSAQRIVALVVYG